MAAKKSELKIALFCGGAGTRMWPASRHDKPKQFQPLIGKESTFTMMAKRLKKGFLASDIFPVTNRDYVGLIVQQAPDIPLENIIIEPEIRDTLAAVGFAAAILNTKFDNPNVLALWSDHLIQKNDQFIKAINAANLLVNEEGKPVEIAVRPTFPSTQLGYLKVGKMTKRINGLGVFEFIQQIEKPDYASAREYYNSWEYLWHIGYSIWPAKYMLDQFERNEPQAYLALKTIAEAIGKSNFEKILTKEYKKIAKTSIDFAILEKIKPKGQFVLSTDLGWSDIGAWDVLKDELSKNADQNVIQGDTIIIDSKDCLIYSQASGKLVATIGLKEMVIVDTPDALLVCSKSKSQDVKKVIELLKDSKKDKLL